MEFSVHGGDFIKFKRIICLICIFAFVLCTFAFADFSSTDSSNLSTVKSKTTSIASYLSTYLPDLSTIATHSANLVKLVGIKIDTESLVSSASTISSRLVSGGNSAANWLELINTKTLNTANRLQYDGKSAAEYLSQISGFLVDNNSTGYQLSVAEWTNSINKKLVNNGTSAAEYLSFINDILQAEKDKQESALDDYSSSGGKSVSDVSGDLGSVSGSVSSNLDSGVSMSKALSAVDDNDDYFHYFFFDMKDDLDTSSSGSSKSSRLMASPNSGSYVPDFVSDYWGGLDD